MSLQVQLLGPPRFLLDGKELTFPFRKALALACYLLVEPRVSREVLADLFWGDRSDDLAARNLRNALYELRKQLPSERIRTDRQWVFLDLEGIDLDLNVLSRWEDISPEELCGLCRPFMEGFVLPDCPPFEDWLRENRSRLHRTCHEVLKKRVRQELEAARDEEALLLLEALMEGDDMDEEVYRLMMSCLCRMGRTGKVVEIYRKLEERLREELGVRPSAETESHYRDLLAREPKPLPGRNITPQAPFFGRAAELARLEACCAKPFSRPRCILVCGEAGVGKTLLVSKFLQGRSAESLILSGWGSHGEGRYALLPWNDLLGDLHASGGLEKLDFPSSCLSLLGESFPALGLGAMAAEPASAARIGAVLADLFGRITSKRPVFINLEDFQWFDDASLEVLESLLLHRPAGVTFLFTARPDADGQGEVMLRSLHRAGRIDLHRIELRSFTQDDMRGFCREYLPSQDFTAEELERLFLQTEGLPLFLAELLRLIGAGHSMDGSPESLAEAIEGVLATVSEEERALLECLSVFLGRADWELLRTFADLPEDRLAEMTDRLKGLSILYERVEEGRKLFIEFSHIRVKEHVRGSLSAARSRFLHRRLAELLMEDMERCGWNDLVCSRIVGHCRAADMRLEELDFTISKLRLHIRLHYELFPLFDDRFLRSASTAFEGRSQTMQELREVRSLLSAMREERGESEKLAGMEMAYRAILGGYLLWWGEYGQGEQLVRAVLDRAAILGKHDLEGECLQHLCYYGIQIEDGDLLESYARRFMEVAVKREDGPAQAMCFRFLGLAHLFRQNFISAEKALKASIGRFEELELLDGTYSLQKAAALNYLGSISHRSGHFQEAVSIYEECLERCEGESIFRGGCLFHSNAAHTAYDMGDRDLMKRHLHAARCDLEECQWWRGNSVLFSLMGLLSAEDGDEEQAVDFLARADELCIPLNKRYWLALQFWAKGLLKQQAAPGGPLARALLEPAESYLIRSRDLYRQMGVQYMVERIGKILA